MHGNHPPVLAAKESRAYLNDAAGTNLGGRCQMCHLPRIVSCVVFCGEIMDDIVTVGLVRCKCNASVPMEESLLANGNYCHAVPPDKTAQITPSGLIHALRLTANTKHIRSELSVFFSDRTDNVQWPQTIRPSLNEDMCKEKAGNISLCSVNSSCAHASRALTSQLLVIATIHVQRLAFVIPLCSFSSGPSHVTRSRCIS